MIPCRPMRSRLYKVYCFRGDRKQVWFEVEDAESRKGVAWSPSQTAAMGKAHKMGYRLIDPGLPPIIRFYRAT